MDKILIVDDNADFLGLIKGLLKTTFEVDTSTTAMDALELIQDNEYKAAILDVSLPDYTGYFLGKRIREVVPFLPIAFLTNYDGEVTRENADEINAEFWRKSDVVSSIPTLVTKIKGLYE